MISIVTLFPCPTVVRSAGDFGRGAERAVVHMASGAPGDLRHLAGRQGTRRAAVELAQRRKGDVAHVHVEAHADRVGRDEIIDLALLIHRELRSEEHKSELQSLMRNSYAVFCLNKN